MLQVQLAGRPGEGQNPQPACNLPQAGRHGRCACRGEQGRGKACRGEQGRGAACREEGSSANADSSSTKAFSVVMFQNIA
eukprot:66467-Karenia_brevis.AAC.1